MNYPEYYKILEIPISAESAEIKRQYRKLAKKYHPDLNKNDLTAAEKFKLLKEAYETLIDEDKRLAYDLEWKKQRKKEQKEKKAQKENKQEKQQNPIVKQKKSSTKKHSEIKQNQIFPKLFYLFLSSTVLCAILFFGILKVLQNKENITELLSKFENTIKNLDGYSVRKEVINNEIENVKKIIAEDTSSQDIANFKNTDGYTLLMLAKTPEMSKTLIDSGADVNYMASDGTTALLVAVKNNNKEQVSVLLDAGASPEIKDTKSGYNALMLAQTEEIAYLLLKAGANPNFIAPDGKTPLSKATKEHNRQRLNLLQQFGAQINWSDVIAH